MGSDPFDGLLCMHSFHTLFFCERDIERSEETTEKDRSLMLIYGGRAVRINLEVGRDRGFFPRFQITLLRKK